MPYKKWTDDDLKDAVKNSVTKSEVIKKLRLSTNSSGNFQTISKYIKKLNLDISHFKSEIFGSPKKERQLSEILIIDSDYTNTSSLKKKLIKHNLLVNKCYNENCGILDWHGELLSLHLDHINGDNSDNRIENLRLLCPNCHSLTITYCRGANRQSKRTCTDCGQPVTKKGNRCIKCNGLSHLGKNLKIIWPDSQILQQMVNEFGYKETGRQLGVTDNTVRKRLKNHPIFSLK